MCSRRSWWRDSGHMRKGDVCDGCIEQLHERRQSDRHRNQPGINGLCLVELVDSAWSRRHISSVVSRLQQRPIGRKINPGIRVLVVRIVRTECFLRKQLSRAQDCSTQAPQSGIYGFVREEKTVSVFAR